MFRQNFRLFLIFYFISLCYTATTYLKNVECNSYIDYVQTDPLKYFRYNPFYVKLHRCHGADSLMNPRNKYCLPTPTGIQELDIYVINNGNGSYEVMKVQNHTSCAEVCLLDQSECSPYQKFSKDECVCMCQYDKTPDPNPCLSPFRWDKSMCDCICSLDSMVCPKRQEFNKNDCGCVCKQKFHVRCAKRQMVVDEETCGCIEPTVITGKSTGQECVGNIKFEMLIIALCLEAFVIIILYLFLYRYCYKVVYFRRKADKERVSISKYQEYKADKVEPAHSVTDFEEEVPPFSMDSLNRNSINRNSINRNSINRTSMNRNGIGMNGIGLNGVHHTNSLNRNNINRTSLTRNNFNTNSLNRNSLRRNTDLNNIYNNNSLFNNKSSDNYEPSEGTNNSNEPYSTNLYPLDERSHLNDPSDVDTLLNDIEPSNFDSDGSGSDYFDKNDYEKNISLV